MSRLTRRSRIRTLCVLAVPGAALLQPRASAAVPPQAADHVEIPLPAGWAPFTADVITVSVGAPTTTGTFHRSADGSVAMLVKTIRLGDLVTIHNVATRATYIRFGDVRGWARMAISESFLRPPEPVLRLPLNRTRRLAHRVERFDIWETVAGRGELIALNHHVPALNGFSILTDQFGTFRQEFTNIRTGEPPPAVFLPPPGTVLDEQDGPRPRLPEAPR